MITYKNRYSDIFTFTLDNEGNILWKGNFMYCRIGYPNDYSKAYGEYLRDGGDMEMEEFKDTIHQYDEDKREYPHVKYLNLVISNKDIIDMVDPSGGPYITSGDDMGRVGEEFKGMIVKEFKRTPTGYKIIVK